MNGGSGRRDGRFQMANSGAARRVNALRFRGVKQELRACIYLANWLYVRRSNRLSLLIAGLRVHETQEGLAVVRTHRCELHPNSLSTFRPPHDSFRT